MSKRKKNTKTNCGIVLSAIGCVIVLLCRLLCSDLAKQPGLIRNIRFALEPSLKEQFSGLIAWYSDNPFASFLLFVLSAAPFILLLLFILKRYGLTKHLARVSKCFAPRDRHRKNIHHQKLHVELEQEPPVQNQASVQECYDAAMKRLEKLQATCGNVKGSDNIFAGDRGVRVQMLAVDPKQQMDQLLEWRGPAGARTAVIPVNSQYEILLKEKRGIPCIVGACEKEETVWTEDMYPLKQNDTVKILRKGEQAHVERCLITWLGGRNQ